MNLKDMKQLQRKCYQMLIARDETHKVPNIGDAQVVYLNARDTFRITTFYTIVDKLETEMRRRVEIYKEISERFSFLSDVPHNATSMTSSSTEIERYCLCCQKLIDANPEDLNTNFSAELQLFHSYVCHKFSATKKFKNKIQLSWTSKK